MVTRCWRTRRHCVPGLASAASRLPIFSSSPSRTGPLFAEGSVGADIHPLIAPAAGELLIAKRLPSSFCGTELQERLSAHSIDTLIIAGLMTHMCVDSTTREAVHLGFRALVVSDACATRDLPAYDGQGVVAHRDLHRAALTALSDRFADIMSCKQVMALQVK